jgi:hypothetical protein
MTNIQFIAKSVKTADINIQTCSILEDCTIPFISSAIEKIQQVI